MEKSGETIFQTVDTGIFSGVGKGITLDFIFCNIFLYCQNFKIIIPCYLFIISE